MKLDLQPFLKQAQLKAGKKIKLGAKHVSFAVGHPKKSKDLLKELKSILSPWQWNQIKSQEQGSFRFETSKGVLFVLFIQEEEFNENITHEGLLDESNYALTRDKIGELFRQVDFKKIESASLHSFDLEYDEVIGLLLGLEISSYAYLGRGDFPSFSTTYSGHLPKKAIEEAIKNAMAIGKATNIARYLVDTPANMKRPVDYANSVQSLFQKSKKMQVTVWDEKRLKKEKMGMMLAVGQGSVQLPRLVHLRYRPAKARDMAPIAFVGKGITFDTGGLDLKPPQAMRLMKKDMGGSASLVGLAYWVQQTNCEIPCDFYLALAENSVDALSFRPSDVIEAHNGLKVEIDNTDAEGRLVLGDTLSLASSQKGKDKPQYLIDIATLTGAIKVGLGAELAGLFSNNDDLAFMLQSCSQIAGDKVWRMPLLPSQRSKLKSETANLTNSANGFGGAIRAAMFLKEFTNDIPWAHLDIYAWTDSPQGPYYHKGGNGQMVQCLAQFISQF